MKSKQKKPRRSAPKGWRPERDAAVFEVLKHLSGLKPAELSSRSGLARSTIRKWYKRPADGGTRYPQHISLTAALAAVGKKFTITDED
jgi:hypothetical protein